MKKCLEQFSRKSKAVVNLCHPFLAIQSIFKQNTHNFTTQEKKTSKNVSKKINASNLF